MKKTLAAILCLVLLAFAGMAMTTDGGSTASAWRDFRDGFQQGFTQTLNVFLAPFRPLLPGNTAAATPDLPTLRTRAEHGDAARMRTGWIYESAGAQHRIMPKPLPVATDASNKAAMILPAHQPISNTQ
jgi:hypothetical protein